MTSNPGRILVQTFSTAFLLAVSACGWLFPVGPAEAQSPPRISDIGYSSAPSGGDTYAAGESISVYVLFDKPVTSIGRSWLPITVGAHPRRAWNVFEGNVFERARAIVYRYIVRADDLDTDGVSIAADALLSADGVIKEADFSTDAVLTHPAVASDSTRKVSGTPFTPGVGVSPQNLAIAEGGTSSYSVVLTSPPTSAVTIAATRSTGGDADLTASPSAFTFRASNWSTAQTVTVSAAQDDDAKDGRASFTHTSSSADTQYDGIEVVKVRAFERDDEPADVARFSHVVPFFSAASSPTRQGLVRIVNHDHEAGTVSIEAIDDIGERFGPVTLSIGAGEAVLLHSGDLEDGNPEKGLSGGVGAGAGDWWLELESALDIEVLAYLQTADGFLSAMHDVVPLVRGGYRVATFNPGSTVTQVSLLRLTNLGDSPATVSMVGIDDRGAMSDAETEVPAGASVTLTAKELEDLGLGDGRGSWQLQVESDQPLRVLNLLRSPSGHLTNLSTAPANVATDNSGALIHHVPFFPAAGGNIAGVIRIVSHDDEPGPVTIRAVDDTGSHLGTVELALEAHEAVDINARDLERGNAAKGLSGNAAGGTGNRRLELESSLDIEVLAYGRARDGFLTSLHDLAPRAGEAHHVGTFNPGRDRKRVSALRLVNPSDAATEVSIVGVDDRGEAREGGATALVPAGAALTYTARELEEGSGEGLDGSIGIGVDRWRLQATSEAPILAMNLVTSPTGHLTNLSTSPGARRDSDGDGSADFVDADDDNDGVSDAADAFPLDPSEWADSDGDGIGDTADADDGPLTNTVVLRGRVTLAGPLAGADVVVSARNGIPIARGETTARGTFELSLNAAAIPEVVLLTAYGGEDRNAGAFNLPATNRGRLRALLTKDRLLNGAGATLNLSPLTEIAYQEAKRRYPVSGLAPPASELSAYLDEVARRYIDTGDYAAVLAFDADTDRASSTLDWNFVAAGLTAAIAAGAGDGEVSSRVSTLAMHFDDEGTQEDAFELRSVSGSGGDRVVTVARAGDAGDVRSVRQTFIDDNGALVHASLVKMNEEKSRVSIDISYAGRTFSITGSSAILEDMPFTNDGLEAFASRIVTLSVQGSEVVVDIDKSLSRAVSDGELIFRVDGRTPRPDEVDVIRDDPVIAWDLRSSSSDDLDLVADAELDGEQVLAWANEDLLLIRVPDEMYAELAGLDEDLTAEAALSVATDILGVIAGSLTAGTSYVWLVAATSHALTTKSVLFYLEHAPDVAELSGRSSRVALRETRGESTRSGAVSETIAPGREYTLDLFFKTHTCGKYSTLEYGARLRDPLDCPHIQLKIDATDTFVYESHSLGVESSSMTIGCPDGYSPPTATTRRCQRRDGMEKSFLIAEFQQPEVPSTTQSLAKCDATDLLDPLDVDLLDLSGSFDAHDPLDPFKCEMPQVHFWIVPRQYVQFELIDWEPRPGEGLAYAEKSLELTDNIGMYSRNLNYRLDLDDLDLLPDFHTRIQTFRRELILDATPTIIVPPAEKAIYRWTWRNPENGTFGHVGIDEVAPSESVERRVPLWTFLTRGTSGVIDITLDLEVTGIRSRGERTTLSKSIVRAVRVADESETSGADDEPLPTFEGASVGDRTLIRGDAMAAWQLPEAEGGVAPLDYALFSPWPPGLSFDPATRRITGRPSETGTWSMRYTATDTYGGSASLAFTIRVTPRSNSRPTAHAGPDQTVTAGARVSLSGAGSSDRDGRVVRYAWSQASGTQVQLSGADTAHASFTAPQVSAETTLVFRLIVTDDGGATDDDTVNVRVRPAGTSNASPVANAGPDQTVTTGARVSLSGAGSSDHDGRVVRYAWSQTGGTGVTLSGANTTHASFAAPNVSSVTTLTFRLRVTDDDGATDDDTVNVRVRPATTPPVTTAVNIPDAILRREIERLLSKSQGETITSAEMATLESIGIGVGFGLRRLTGLEHATNLEVLLIFFSSVEDLSPLAGLTSLLNVDIVNASISSVSPLSGLRNLAILLLSGNSISDISPLSSLIGLNILALSSNSISNISALSSLTNLTSLNLAHNSISDISPLVRNQGLNSATTVNLEGNPLSSTSVNVHIPALRARGVTVQW